MILTQENFICPFIQAGPYTGGPKGLHTLAYAFASPLLQLRPASSATRLFRITSPAKTTSEGKGHFINRPYGVGFEASLSECSEDLVTVAV